MQYSFSSRIQSIESSAVRDILKLTQGQSIISFAGGLPAEEWFPIEHIREASDRVLSQAPQALQYGLTEGVVSLREGVLERLSRVRGIHGSLDDIMITSGSQQTLDLFAKAVINPGDVVFVEDPTYLACLQVLRLYGADVIGVASDDQGMIPEDLEQKLKQHRPKFVYVVPTFGNPSGRVWSVERRQALLDQCKANHVLILEDDPYGDLRFSGEAVPNIAKLEGKGEDRIVIYTSTFSKTVAPGLRTGYVVADKRIIAMMARGKQACDLHSSVLDQLILSELLVSETFSIDKHIEKLSHIYRERMETMAGHLQEDRCYKEAKWSMPQGGMFFWVELPEGLDAEALLKCSVQKGVAFVPGAPFFAQKPKRNTMRLNYSFAEPTIIHEGMNRLSEAVEEFLGRYAG
ncbi:PLP-dependent aminotransferase family protein [Paenibacillus aquistagni]|uniref:2-aminoadipate transaminase n=1 Tax=Paenibacillus aquistagni TaxID=1852522 RepID=A0A1X7LKS3_9BACL|nr:PLP-dependent aminotransferase family protein [Paenibacillus aquistagni]SMG54486.1 2-aminoadipate transaminase [Paenibacillus aquistagni]